MTDEEREAYFKEKKEKQKQQLKEKLKARMKELRQVSDTFSLFRFLLVKRSGIFSLVFYVKIKKWL